jgi:hypothetical protein
MDVTITYNSTPLFAVTLNGKSKGFFKELAAAEALKLDIADAVKRDNKRLEVKIETFQPKELFVLNGTNQVYISDWSRYADQFGYLLDLKTFQAEQQSEAVLEGLEVFELPAAEDKNFTALIEASEVLELPEGEEQKLLSPGKLQNLLPGVI